MGLSYLQNCPSCGAPIELEEADRVITCTFCDIKNYMVSGGPLRFVLPNLVPREIGQDEIFHIPYLRFKGHIFSCHEHELAYKIIDTSQIGFSSKRFPHSLGLKPQAMKIRPVGATHQGRFVRLTEKVKEVFSKAAKLSSTFSDNKNTVYHRAFIGETISFIYLPTYYREGKLFDGVLNREMYANIPRNLLLKLSTDKKKEWFPQFISTNCPHCASAMAGEGDSLMMECHNCSSLWQEQNGSFEKLVCSLVETERADVYLPFWQIKSRVTGVQLESFADFLKITNQPIFVQDQFNTIQHNFWIPAFKIRPKHFLHFAKNMTISQTKIPEGTDGINKKIYPATFPLKEAVQALKVALAASVLNRKKFMAELPHISIDAEGARLTFLPFHYLGHDLVQDHTGVTVGSNILHYGRTM